MAWWSTAARAAKGLQKIIAGTIGFGCSTALPGMLVDPQGDNTHVEPKRDAVGRIPRLLEQRWHFEAFMQQPLRNIIFLASDEGEEVRRWLREQDAFWAVSFCIKEEKKWVHHAFCKQLRKSAERESAELNTTGPVPIAVVERLSKVTFPQAGTRIDELSDIVCTPGGIHYYQLTYSSEVAHNPDTQRDYVSVALALGGMTFGAEGDLWDSLKCFVEKSVKTIDIWHSEPKLDFQKDGSKLTAIITPEMRVVSDWKMIVHHFNERGMSEWSDLFHEIHHGIHKEQSREIQRVFSAELTSGSFTKEYTRTYKRSPAPIIAEKRIRGKNEFELEFECEEIEGA